MMTDLKRMQDKVEWCLEKYPKTRENDRVLIGTVYTRFYGVDIMTPLRDILLDDELPSFESIRRCRQKVQELRGDLRAKDEVEQMRFDAQKDFIEYAREA